MTAGRTRYSLRRRIWWLSGAAALLVIVSGLSHTWFGSLPATSQPSLPRRVGAPGILTRDARTAPMGAAGVAFTAADWGFSGSVFDVALTGLRGDSYRTLPESLESTAGISAILSPDGRRLAVVGGIVDLATGKVMRLPSQGPHDVQVPEAWSPDGRRLAVATYSQPDFAPVSADGPWLDRTTDAVLSIVDVWSGVRTAVGDLHVTANFDGWIAAFSPNGRQLAYQSGDRIVVVADGENAVSSFAVPDGTRIGGKGAWTGDGRSLALVSEQPCRCVGPYDSRWTLATVDARTGSAVGPEYAVDGVVAIRSVGWSPMGEPVVVSYEPGTAADLGDSYHVVDFRAHASGGYDQTALYISGIEDLDDVYRARVLALDVSRAPRVLVASAFGGAESIDVADQAVTSGASRPGRPPLLTFDRVILGLMELAVVVILVALIILVRALRRHVTRARGAGAKGASAAAPATN